MFCVHQRSHFLRIWWTHSVGKSLSCSCSICAWGGPAWSHTVIENRCGSESSCTRRWRQISMEHTQFDAHTSTSIGPVSSNSTPVGLCWHETTVLHQLWLGVAFTQSFAFSGFRLNSKNLIALSMSLSIHRRSSKVKENPKTLSRYTRHVYHLKPANTVSTTHWNVAGVEQIPSGITLNSNNPSRL